jgi:PKD repeat protein
MCSSAISPTNSDFQELLIMRHTYLSLPAVIALTAMVAGCTVKGVEQPPFAGPSTLALSITMKATPDTLLQDGASQSIITITALDAEGRTRTIPLRADIAVDGIVQDFGRLSTKQPVTNGAPLIYTSPPSPILAAGQVAQTVTIRVTPTDGSAFDGRGEFSREVDILLVPQGVVLPTNPNLLPAFVFTPTSPQAFQTVNFDATTTSNSGSQCLGACSYAWNFGDGTTGSGITTSHVFRTVGTTSVTLTVTDTRGAQASTTRSITIGSLTQPTGPFTTSPSTNLSTNVDIFFNASNVQWTGRNITRYDWSFGDGRTGSGITTTHRYTTAGTFTVTLTLTDDLGAQGQLSQTLTVSTLGGAAANIRASATTVTRNQRVVFDATGSTPSAGASIVSYRFIYGDGSEELTDNPIQSHSFSAAGTYPVTVVITDSNGKSATASVTVTVS